MAPDDDGPLAAGSFSEWLAATRAALAGDVDADVPCDGCTACCRSSQFIQIGPDEVDAIAHIPAPLLFPAPRLPRGHVVLGYDERGHCPMLVDDACSIYEHRPRACRTYDCRIFTAAGIEVDDEQKVDIARRVRRWRFAHPSESDQRAHDAVRAAAAADDDASDPHAADAEPLSSATQRAVRAVERYREFLAPSPRHRD